MIRIFPVYHLPFAKYHESAVRNCSEGKNLKNDKDQEKKTLPEETAIVKYDQEIIHDGNNQEYDTDYFQGFTAVDFV